MIEIKKAYECEIFQVKTIDKSKFIEILVYIYERDEDPKWGFVEGQRMLFELKGFVENYAEREQEYVDELWEQARQYQDDLTESEAVKAMNFYKIDAVLHYSQVDENTPDGTYVNDYEDLEAFLQSQGFKRDETCPDGVNRWEKEDGKREDPYVIGRTFHASITLDSEGRKTLYGRINFLGDYGYILKSRKFEGELKLWEITNFLIRDCDVVQAAIVKCSPYC